MQSKTRLEELFDRMLDEAPVMFTPKMKPYILEFARIYAKEVAEKALEEGFKNSLFDWNSVSKNHSVEYKNSITNPKNIKLD